MRLGQRNKRLIRLAAANNCAKFYGIREKNAMHASCLVRYLLGCAWLATSVAAQTCPNGSTSISGTVYAPNGTDPLPNVMVYIPSAPVEYFTPGVSCPAAGLAPSGSP